MGLKEERQGRGRAGARRDKEKDYYTLVPLFHHQYCDTILNFDV